MCFMNLFTSESEMIREMNVGIDCPALVQPDILLLLFSAGKAAVMSVLGQTLQA